MVSQSIKNQFKCSITVPTFRTPETYISRPMIMVWMWRIWYSHWLRGSEGEADDTPAHHPADRHHRQQVVGETFLDLLSLRLRRHLHNSRRSLPLQRSPAISNTNMRSYIKETRRFTLLADRGIDKFRFSISQLQFPITLWLWDLWRTSVIQLCRLLGGHVSRIV